MCIRSLLLLWGSPPPLRWPPPRLEGLHLRPLISRRRYSGHTKRYMDDRQCRKRAMLFLDAEQDIEKSLRQTVGLINVARIVGWGTESVGQGKYGGFSVRGICLPTCLPNTFQVLPECSFEQEALLPWPPFIMPLRLHYINNPDEAILPRPKIYKPKTFSCRSCC